MASGSSAVGFGSDAYEDYGTHDTDNGIHTDPSMPVNSAQEFHRSRMARSTLLPAATYNPPEEPSFDQNVISTVENSMKKHTDNLMRFLEGISSRLSQLELYCYNLDKSIGEMRSDLVRDHGESESKLKSLEKHIQEVHRSMLILRDKQELVDTQKELAKLQLAQKNSASQQNEDRASEDKRSDSSSDVHDQPLALALLPQQPSLPARPVEHHQPQSSMPSQSMQPVHAYYLQSQVQDQNRMGQWPQQVHLSVQPPQQQVTQPQIRHSSQVVYSSYLPSQSNQSPPTAEIPFVVASSQPASAMHYGFAPIQQQHHKTEYGAQYVANGPRQPLPPGGNAYMSFDGQTHFQQQQTPYPPPTSFPSHNAPPQHNNMVVPSSQSMRAHPYNELIEKMVSMGYRGDHVVGIIQRLEESRQPVDFNTVLDRLNGHSSGGSQRGWSG